MPFCILCQPIVEGRAPDIVPDTIMHEENRHVLNPGTNMVYIPVLAEHEKVGLEHHQNLAALEDSAHDCALCDLIRNEIEHFLVEHRTKHADPAFTNFYRHYGLADPLSLRVTNAADGRNGFMVVAYSDEPVPSKFFVLAVIGFCCELDDQARSPYPSGRIDAYGGSELTLNRVTSWIDDCTKNHTCPATKETGIVPMPSRVLDLSRPDMITLRDTHGEKGKYAALSYCWGSGMQLTTTKRTLDARRLEIPLAILPQTAKDAVLLARQLKLQYLWIDALCICQDDEEDWAREAADMSQIYAHAYIVIAAGSGFHADSGMLKRNPPQFVPIELDNQVPFLACGFRPYQILFPGALLKMTDQHLTSRAWAYQERMLARRVLHYTTEQTYFECAECLRCEDGTQLNAGYSSFLWNDLDNPYFKSRPSIHSRDHMLWHQCIEVFTERRLTFKRDKLPALSGLAQEFQRRIGAKYVAGLWSDSLIEGLCWTSIGRDLMHRPQPRTSYIAPTWSWASNSGNVAGGMPGDGWKAVAELQDYKIELKTSNPYGEIESGWMRIRAALLPLSLVNDDEELAMNPRIWPFMRLKTSQGQPEGHYATFDDIHRQNPEARDWVRSLTLYAVVLARQNPEEGDFFLALIVTPAQSMSSETSTTEYERLGIVHLHDIEEEMRPAIQDVLLV